MVKRYVKVPDPRDSRRFVRGIALNFKTIKEDWNVYELEDGTIVRIKLVAQSISYVEDPDTGDIMRSQTGEPIVNVRHQVIVVAEFPEGIIGEVKEVDESEGNE